MIRPDPTFISLHEERQEEIRDEALAELQRARDYATSALDCVHTASMKYGILDDAGHAIEEAIAEMDREAGE
jgi:hypothetical protein